MHDPDGTQPQGAFAVHHTRDRNEALGAAPDGEDLLAPGPEHAFPGVHPDPASLIPPHLQVVRGAAAQVLWEAGPLAPIRGAAIEREVTAKPELPIAVHSHGQGGLAPLAEGQGFPEPLEALQGAVPEHTAAGDLHLATVRVRKEGIGRGGLGPALDRVEGAPSIREVRLEARGQNPDLATGIPSQVVDPHLRQACGRHEGQGGEFQKAQAVVGAHPDAVGLGNQVGDISEGAGQLDFLEAVTAIAEEARLRACPQKALWIFGEHVHREVREPLLEAEDLGGVHTRGLGTGWGCAQDHQEAQDQAQEGSSDTPPVSGLCVSGCGHSPVPFLSHGRPIGLKVALAENRADNRAESMR